VGSSLLKHQQISRPGGFATEAQRSRRKISVSLCLCGQSSWALNRSLLEISTHVEREV